MGKTDFELGGLKTTGSVFYNSRLKSVSIEKITKIFSDFGHETMGRSFNAIGG